MYIKGIGMTKFGFIDKPTHLIAYDAITQALEDAGTKITQIDLIVSATLEWLHAGERQRHFSSLLSSLLKTNVPIIRVPAACASGGAALWTANNLGHKYNNILVVGAEKLLAKNNQIITDEFMMAAESRWEQQEGLNFPAQNALIAQEYLSRYPEATTDDLALISLKNHEHGFLNPKARFYQKKVALDQIKNSPVVASPLRLFDCSVSVDGAAAVILTNDKTNIEISGSALATDYLPMIERKDLTSWKAVVNASKEAHSQANTMPEDINFAELHDAFTIVEMIAYEDLGFAKPGQGSKLIKDQTTKIDGSLPINTSGGLKARGHPISTTGLAQIYEIVNQMRNECGDRQLTKTKTALAHNVGGIGGTAAVHILKKR